MYAHKKSRRTTNMTQGLGSCTDWALLGAYYRPVVSSTHFSFHFAQFGDAW